MIVRESKDYFVMIEQDNHAEASKELMTHWKNNLFLGSNLRESVEYAIEKHDYGWKQFDKQPFWNDQTEAPYTFSDFPISPKTTIYTYGINEVEKHDLYAALLCSEHYKNFFVNIKSNEATRFIQQERERQKRLILTLGDVNRQYFQFHYGLLKLGDSLSLYLCLNEPGVSKENVHYFFQEGIDLPPHIEKINETKLSLEWKDKKTVAITPFPFEDEIKVTIKQKVVYKEAIQANGLLESYENAPYEEIKINVVSK
ncbi:DUF3891 family protein [Oceanobacillus halophilus]|uniref:DUF3891 family protein n=1 Tax=Oceanobacillus halophilus TaxID=930130 RepID=A0A494ZT62_9BACI|nr:DUF3891 family protein [Oceanobacillus halophilus]RKQ28804.1 DUF3891 family protein [Oceanobacillus halophilus]